MQPALATFQRLSTNQSVAASTVLVNLTGFTVNLNANQKVHAEIWLPFTLGATGGFKFQWIVPANPGNLISSYSVQDLVTPAVINGVQTSSTPFANALAQAGTHLCTSTIDYVNGSTAGTFAFQFACNSAANAITALQGAFMNVLFL